MMLSTNILNWHLKLRFLIYPLLTLLGYSRLIPNKKTLRVLMKLKFLSIALLLPFTYSNMLYGSAEIEDLLIDYQGKNSFKPIAKITITDKRKAQDNKVTLESKLKKIQDSKKDQDNEDTLEDNLNNPFTQDDLDIRFLDSEDFTDQYYASCKRPVYYHSRTRAIENKFEHRTIITTWLKSKGATFINMRFPSPKENDKSKIIKHVHIEENGLLKVAVAMCMGLKEFDFEIKVPEGYYFPITLEENAATKEVFTGRDLLYQKATKWLKEDLIKAKMKEADSSLSPEEVITAEVAEQLSKEVLVKLPLSIETEALFEWLNKRSVEIWKPVMEDASKFNLNPADKEFRNSRKRLQSKIDALKEGQKKKIEELKAKK
jgi:hypothetical protein